MADGTGGPLRLAVVGAGDVAWRDYLPHMAGPGGRLGDLGRVEMVVAGDAVRAEAAARAFGVPRHAAGWEAALDPGVDAVVNLTPGPLHGAVNLAVAASGRHLYSEKPLALDLPTARAVAEAARASGGRLASAPSVMVFPQVRAAAGVLARGGIGAVRAARALATVPPPPWEGFVGDYGPYFGEGIGAVVDIGVYAIHALAGLLGEVAEVAALSTRSRQGFEAPGGWVEVRSDDTWQAVLRLRSGVPASLLVSFAAEAAPAFVLEIMGERGTLAVSLIDPAVPLVVRGGGGERVVEVAHERLDGPDHVLGVRELLRAVREGREPVIGAGPALHGLAVIAALRGSAREGRFVAVEATGWTGL